MDSEPVLSGASALIFIFSLTGIVLFALLWVFGWSIWGVSGDEKQSR